MKTIPVKKLEEDAALYTEIANVLEKGGLVCVPCGGSYRIVANLNSAGAVQRLLQSKRRTQKAPSLVFVEDEKMLRRVALEVSPMASRLIRAFWPGPLTILFTAHPDLPEEVVDPLVEANGKLGVRMPHHPVVKRLVQTFGKPLLVSSANPEKRKGSSSPAQVRKTFLGKVDLFVDAGDLPSAPASTVVDVEEGKAKITRPGAIDDEEIKRVANG
jgi:L-threonylcarbamoyladenylate synthase